MFFRKDDYVFRKMETGLSGSFRSPLFRLKIGLNKTTYETHFFIQPAFPAL